MSQRIYDTEGTYLSRRQSIVIVWLVVTVTEQATQLAHVEPGNVNGADHGRILRARDTYTVIGLDVSEKLIQVGVEVLRVGWEIGRFIMDQNLKARSAKEQLRLVVSIDAPVDANNMPAYVMDAGSILTFPLFLSVMLSLGSVIVTLIRAPLLKFATTEKLPSCMSCARM